MQQISVFLMVLISFSCLYLSACETKSHDIGATSSAKKDKFENRVYFNPVNGVELTIDSFHTDWQSNNSYYSQSETHFSLKANDEFITIYMLWKDSNIDSLPDFDLMADNLLRSEMNYRVSYNPKRIDYQLNDSNLVIILFSDDYIIVIKSKGTEGLFRNNTNEIIERISINTSSTEQVDSFFYQNDILNINFNFKKGIKLISILNSTGNNNIYFENSHGDRYGLFYTKNKSFYYDFSCPYSDNSDYYDKYITKNNKSSVKRYPSNIQKVIIKDKPHLYFGRKDAVSSIYYYSDDIAICLAGPINSPMSKNEVINNYINILSAFSIKGFY